MKKVVLALGGNALLRRGEPLTANNQMKNIKRAAEQIAILAQDHQLVITHGNGPQVGLLALQASAYDPVEPYPLDVLGAETEGMIGYLLAQEIANHLPDSRPVVSILTRVEVDPNDPAFLHPTKPIGPVYSSSEAEQLANQKKWIFAADGKGMRRVVSSPKPKRILEIAPIQWMLEQNAVVIAAGGGGIPIFFDQELKVRKGVEAVIDKDLCSSLLAIAIAADLFIISTDVEAVYKDWGQPSETAIEEISVAEVKKMKFAAGSMAPKIEAACQFVEATNRVASIGSIENINKMVAGISGTRIVSTYPKAR